MKLEKGNFIWGILLILLGAFALAQGSDWFSEWETMAVVGLLALLGAIALAGYIVNGWRRWALLIPAMGLLGSALLLWLVEEANVEGEIAGGLFMTMISVPFWIAFLSERQRNWWALIPGWVLLAIGLVLTLADLNSASMVGALVMLAIALPFYVLFFARSRFWWAIIVAVIMTVLFLIVLLGDTAAEEFAGAIFMAGVAITFFVIYTKRRNFWWALLTVGIATTLSIVILLDQLDLANEIADRLIPAILFSVPACTLGALYIMRDRYPTDWAIYPAAVLLASAIITAIFGTLSEVVYALLLIMVGVAIIAGAARSREKKPITEPFNHETPD
jgi:hypothetical protein